MVLSIRAFASSTIPLIFPQTSNALGYLAQLVSWISDDCTRGMRAVDLAILLRIYLSICKPHLRKQQTLASLHQVAICRYHDAIKLLRELLNSIMYDSRRGYWALRLSIDLEHLGHFNESLSIAEKGVDDPWIRAGSKMALQRRISISGRPLKNEIGEKSLFYGTDNELCGVEKLALQYYAEEGGGWQGIHSESGIWTTIFGLLMWGVIFSDVPNVFRSKFQV
ncbi:hypothetical protein KSP40_PGU002904 [Platanthera guangdongensis]|uniref:Fanconi-associated nuclease n=1 Tax=Platanthera guangdongensis TaxID=2320717 RepID=A0ABR2LCH9_9ASPA